jgi:hypothetical protein
MLLPCKPSSRDVSAREFFVQGPPSSRDDNPTGIFRSQKVHPHHVTTSAREFFVQGPPLSHDDDPTGIFCSQKVHPHHVMMTPREFFVQGPPSSRDDNSTSYVNGLYMFRAKYFQSYKNTV